MVRLAHRTMTSEVIESGRTADDALFVTVGPLLQHWRKSRRLSQLALAVDAGVSARHLCCLETGKAQPSREMVLHLAGVLDLPLRERNDLLVAAGFAPMYPESKLDARALAVVRTAVGSMLRQHEPFPAVVMDRHWDVTDTNDAAKRLFAFLLGKRRAAGPANVLRMMFHPEGLRPFVRNWPAVAASLLDRARREVVGGLPDDVLRDLVGEITSYPGVAKALGATPSAVTPLLPIIPVVFEKDDRRYDFFSTVTTLGTAHDVTVQEIRIECFFPADEATAKLARASLREGR
jgi:transcriptional regulator with XRE-family HTH domain